LNLSIETKLYCARVVKTKLSGILGNLRWFWFVYIELVSFPQPSEFIGAEEIQG